MSDEFDLTCRCDNDECGLDCQCCCHEGDVSGACQADGDVKGESDG